MILSQLLAREVHRHEGTIFVTGYDPVSENMVCYVVVNSYLHHIRPSLVEEGLAFIELQRAENIRQSSDANHEYMLGLIYVSAAWGVVTANWTMGALHITADDYAQLAAEAEAQS